MPAAPREHPRQDRGSSGCRRSLLSHTPLPSGVVFLPAVEILWADWHGESPTWDNVWMVEVV